MVSRNINSNTTILKTITGKRKEKKRGKKQQIIISMNY